MKNNTAIWRLSLFGRRVLLAVFGIMCLLFSSCIREESVALSLPDSNSIRIELRLPGEPYSYALTELDENVVHELDVLVFREGAGGRENFVGSVAVDPAAISDTDTDGRTKTCTVEVPVSDAYKQRLVFIANAHSAVQGAQIGALKDALLAGIVYTMPGNWPTEGSAFIPFPMWGETPLIDLATTTENLSESIYLMRAVARVDMGVDAALKGDFKLHEVYLYNRYEKGCPVPAATVLEGSGSTLKVTGATVPAGARPTQIPASKSDATYGEHYTTDESNYETVTGRIYLMENAPTTLPLDATCFVVGGKHNGGAMRYWRVDIPKQGGGDITDGFRTFLRNNAYEIILTAINGPGCKTPDDAFRMSWHEVDTDVTQWDLRDIVWGDHEQFTLRATPAAFEYLRGGTGGTPGAFSVWSDYYKSDSEQGWTGEWSYSDNDGSWLQITPPVFSGAKGQTKDYTFTVAENTTGKDRHAYMKVTAGSLIKYVDIHQTNQVLVVDNTDPYDWTESDQSPGAQDGPYRLGVSSSHIAMDKVAASNGSFNITTDYTNGYTTTLEGGSDWLSITDGGSSAGPVTGQTLTFHVKDNPDSEPREAVIVVQAGNLQKRVRVTQFDDIWGDTQLTMDWAESEHTPGALDGPYKLGVGRTHYDFLKNSQTAVELPIATDHPSGYKADVTVGAEWIKIKTYGQSTSAWPGPVVMTFDVDENNGVVTREGEICITAGNLKKYITVSQSFVAGVDTGGDMDWTESDHTPGALDGPYKLGVGRTCYDFLKNLQEGVELPIATDHPSGYKAEVTVGSEWIKIKTYGQSTSAWPDPVVMTFDVDENNGVVTREGEICITAGNLKKYITVYQSFIADVDTDGDVNGWEDEMGEDPLHGLYNIAVGRQSFTVSGEGHTLSTTVTADASTTGVLWTATTTADAWITGVTASGAANGTAQELSFTLAANGGAVERTGKIAVSVIHRGNKITKDIHVRQFASSEQIMRTEMSGYVTDGLVRQSFTLYAKMDWSIRVKHDPSGIVRTLYTTGGKANGGTGEAVYFALNTFSATSPPTGNAPYEAELEITSPTGAFLPVRVTISASLLP